MDKIQAQKEAQALNKFKNKRIQTCQICNGSGKKYSPVFGDPGLGYVATGACQSCKGTGKEKIQ